jgi:hypothetical protein
MVILNEGLLKYFRSKKLCELCGRPIPHGRKAEPHHVKCRGHGGGSRLDVALNLVSACWLCHGQVQEDPQGQARCVEVIAYREGLLPEQVQEAIWRLLQRDKYERAPVW